MTRPLFYAPAPEIGSLAVGDRYLLSGTEAHHAATVRRLVAGEEFLLSDAEGLRLSCVVEQVSAGRPSEASLLLEVTGVDREESPAPQLTLVQALAKDSRDEQAVETATELGVDAVYPWQAERSIVRWKAERAAKALAKWRSVVWAAAKQSRRSVVPAVHQPLDSGTLADWVRAGAGTRLVLMLDEESAQPLRELVPVDSTLQEVAVIVGPEGGISPRERDLLAAAGALSASLGPHVLRSSTAGPAAIVLLNEILRRW
ncbi:16S rRNA (uracil(1498)-N(3))-methyltransferase [Psychromicrobium xiongbiense]|uniref:16S rRNA (uracil(1498)-N(3))-methyltransferase n=1 Tax=Psychromicrobium xiongbiense TaxID=3051184 RepID=UPI0025521381|nr:16S rRNA (uracil(1498)-N(3))-methyltransferase [Psychromicrobium sp. YIM S02556]